MTRTDEKVRYSPESKPAAFTRETAAEGVENVLKLLEGRWKLIILFHLFGGNVMRFSDLERAIPTVSQKMLIQQLRQMESDGIVRRIAVLGRTARGRGSVVLSRRMIGDPRPQGI